MTPLTLEHSPGEGTPAYTIEQNRRTLEPGKPLLDFFLGLMDMAVLENRERNLVLHRRGLRLQKYYEGDLGGFHPTSGAWISRPSYAMGDRNAKTDKTSPWHPQNKIRRYFDANTAQTLQARFDLRAGATREDDRSQLAASCARPIVDYYERNICDELFVQEIDKQKRCYGEVGLYCYWDLDAGPDTDELGVAEEDYLPGGSIYTCLSCAGSGDQSDFQNGCPTCGPQAPVAQEDYPSMKLPTFGVTGKKRAGDFCVDVVPKLQYDYDRFAPKFSKCGWYSRTRRMRPEELEAQFPFYKAPQNRDEVNDRSVDYAESGTGNTGRSMPFIRSSGDKRTMVRQFWFRPYLLSQVMPDIDVPLAGGEKIPAGVKLSEVFPDGAYVLFSGRNVMDIWNDEHINHRWVQIKHKHIPNRLDGDGGEDIIRPQQTFNEAHSYVMSAWRQNVCRPQVVRAPLKESDWQVGNPIVQVAGLGQGINLKDLHSVAEPVTIDESAMAVMQLSDAEMQSSESAFGTTTGDPDVRAQGGGKTLGGLQIIDNNASEQRLPELSLMALGWKQMHENGLYFFKECATEQRWIPFKAGAGELAGAYFKGSDLEGDIELSFGKASYLPKDSQRRRANLMGALEVGQGMVLNPQMDPKWRELILDTFEIDITLDDYTKDVQNARERIEKMKQALPLAQHMAQTVGMIAQQAAMQRGMNGPLDGGSAGGAGGMDSGGALPYGQVPPEAAPQVDQPAGGNGIPVASGQMPAGQPDTNGNGQDAGAMGATGQQPPLSDGAGVAGSLQGTPPGIGGPGNANPAAQQPLAPPNAAQLLCEIVPIDPQVDNHAVHYKWIKEWLKGDEAKKVAPEVNEAMHLRLEEHEQAGAQQAAREQAMAMQANAPQMMLQQSQMNQQNTRQDQQSAQQSQQNQQMKADDREHQLNLEDKRQAGLAHVATIRAKNTKAAKR